MTGIIVSIFLLSNSFTLSSRFALSPLFPTLKNPEHGEEFYSRKVVIPESINIGKFSLLHDSVNNPNPLLNLKEAENAKISNMGSESGLDFINQKLYGSSQKYDGLDDDYIDLPEDEHPDSTISLEVRGDNELKNASQQRSSFISQEKVVGLKHILMSELTAQPIRDSDLISDNVSTTDQTLLPEQITTSKDYSVSHQPAMVPEVLKTNSSFPVLANIPSIMSSGENMVDIDASSDQQGTVTLLGNETFVSSHIKLTASNLPLVKDKKRMFPVSVMEMNRLLFKHHATYHSLRRRKYSSHDKKMLAALAQIENSTPVKTDHELYAPIFRNISMFTRSYELMERTLKIYVYKDGQKPIFHQPLLKGIYASEGWFMKLMETSRHYLVKDPRKAHLFYMPFSSRLLQHALYVPNSHSYRNLEQYLTNYVVTIASKYPFWNRTGGADHFLAACHDWAPSETRQAMKNSIRALCNADLSEGFQLGKDVSLPEIYIRSARNPLRDLGGMPANERPTLAFFAGKIHGRLRPILLKHWEGKDPDMKIFGPMLPGVERKMIYIHHMKTSKYCICPRGFEVNSPRVVESMYYECVPVIISDNFVPPFFEVLNWEAFAVIIAEEDVPRLKEILVSIPEEKYLSLQKGVRMVQQHFLWHSSPVKYDLFNMILHSIWFNRLHQIGTR